jgi:hypothetical protein
MTTRLAGRRAVPAIAAGAAFVALSVGYFVDPNKTKLPLCPLHATTGLWCPFCGATRATHALLHGDLSTAVHDNALYVVMIPLVGVIAWRWYGPWRAPQPRRVIPRVLLLGLISLAVVFGVVRNLPFGAFLAPPS